MKHRIERETLCVLLVDSGQELYGSLTRHLQSTNRIRIDAAANAAEAHQLISARDPPYAVALINDLLQPDPDRDLELIGVDLVRQIREYSTEVECIVLVDANTDRGLAALQEGAYRYLSKPLDLDELDLTVQRLAKERAHRRQERNLKTALLRIGQVMSSKRDRKRALEIIAEEACQALQGWRAKIVLHLGQHMSLDLTTVGPWDKHDTGSPIRQNGISVQVMDSGEPWYTEDAQRIPQVVNPAMVADGVRAAACVPFGTGNMNSGVMWIHYREPRQLLPAEIESLCLYAKQAAIAYDNAREMQELEHLRRAAAKLASIASVHEILEQIVRSAREVMGTSSAVIWPYDALKDEFLPNELVADGVESELLERFRTEKPRSDGTAKYVIQQGYLEVENVDDPIYAYLGPAAPGLRGAIGVKAFQGITLRVENEPLGVLYTNYRFPRSFAEKDRHTIETFAHHASLALKRARLLAQVNKVRDTVKIVTETSVLGDLESTLRSVVQGIKDVFHCDAVTLYSYNESKEEFDFPPTMIGTRYPEQVPKQGPVTRESVLGRILQLEAPYIAHDAPSDPLVGGPFVEREGIKCSIVIPLIGIGQPSDTASTRYSHRVGVTFVNYRSRRDFTQEDLENIQLFAYQAAIAIHNAQLYEDMKSQSAASKALYEASRTVISSQTLDGILDCIAEQAYNLVFRSDRSACASHLIMVEGGRLRLAAMYPKGQKSELQDRLDKVDLTESPELEASEDERIGIVGRAVREGRPQRVSDANQDRDYIEFYAETRSELAVPIHDGKRVIGVINVEHPHPDAFRRDDQLALESLAGLAAIAIRNARQTRLLEAILDAGKAIVTNIDMEQRELLTFILEQAFKSICWFKSPKSVLGNIVLYDELANETYYESIYPPEKFPDIVNRLGERYSLDPSTPDNRIGLTGRSILRGRVQIVPDVSKSTDYREVYAKTRSEMDAPLRIGNKVLGALGLESDCYDPFDQLDARALVSLADLAAIVIQISRQYKELEHSKGIIGARTAAAWLGMASSTWWHEVQNQVRAIRDRASELSSWWLRLPAHLQDSQAEEDIAKIRRAALEILERHALPPLFPKGELELVSVGELIRERVKQLWEHDRFNSVRPRLDIPRSQEMFARVSPEWLRQAFDILVENAVDAVAESKVKEIEIKCRMVDKDYWSKEIEISVKDTGTGIPEEIRNKIFWEPISESKGDRGLGMGLLMAQVIVQAFGGEISIGPTGPEGTTMIIRLPAVQ